MVSSFAASIKPNVFDGSKYKWCERLVLMAMNIMHVAKRKPKQFTPEEGNAHEASDNLSQDCIMSVIAKSLVDSYILLTNGMDVWDALEA